MITSQIIRLTVMILLTIISFIISYRQFKEKGFLFNNAYLYASEAERKEMNKKPYYRQSAIAFCYSGSLFFLIAMAIFTGWKWTFYVGLILSIFAIVYAVISSVNIERKRN